MRALRRPPAARRVQRRRRGVPKSVALGDIDALVPASAGDDARNLFRQGLALRFGFNVDEARRISSPAADAAADGPNGVGCAVCLWGIARSLMPNVNNYKTRRPARDAARAALAAARTIVERMNVIHSGAATSDTRARRGSEIVDEAPRARGIRVRVLRRSRSARRRLRGCAAGGARAVPRLASRVDEKIRFARRRRRRRRELEPPGRRRRRPRAAGRGGDEPDAVAVLAKGRELRQPRP